MVLCFITSFPQTVQWSQKGEEKGLSQKGLLAVYVIETCCFVADVGGFPFFLPIEKGCWPFIVL